MTKEEYHFSSKDDTGTKIHGVKWLCDGEPKSVLMIVHGMQEYIERYEEFAEYLCKKGFVVYGHDHIGHGESVSDASERGIMHTKHPAETMVEDMYTQYLHIKEEYPSLPCFIMGHSMGSYLLRWYLSVKADSTDGLSGAIIMGTGTEKTAAIKAGKTVVHSIAAVHGWDYRSTLVQKTMFGAPYQRYDVTGTDHANSWLSKNEESVAKYYADPKCNYMFSVNGYRILLDATDYDNKMVNIAKIRKDLPVLFVSGADDPVGNMGKGVKEAAKKFKRAGIAHVALKLYANDRHEILNEPDRQQVYKDIFRWMKRQMKG